MSIKVKWPKVLNKNELDSHPLLEWMNLGNVTMFRISAFLVKKPARGIVVGIERKGMFFFKWPSEYLRGGYVAEKLNLCDADANIIADWINAQLGFAESPQQCNYYEREILSNESPLLCGESTALPLVAQII